MHNAIVSRYHPVCKGNALNLNADDNISGESLDESLGNPWGNPGESLDESLDESLGNP